MARGHEGVCRVHPILAHGVRGPGGGYFLGREADQITIANIICAVDEWVEFTRCQGKENCVGGHRCMTHSLWNSLSEKIYDFLEGITLGDLIENSDVLDVAERQKKQKDSLKLVS